MFSAVPYPQPLPPPQPSVREQAAAGYFQAIALWINEPLAPQGIFVKVQADGPGRLRLIVEFKRPPMKERLLRFLCHRVWLLNSELIEGIHVIARPVGWRRIAWEKRIRIVTPALKQRKAALQAAPAQQRKAPLPPQIRQNVVHLSSKHLKTLRSLVLTGSAVAAFVFGCLLEVIMSGASPVLPSFSARSSPAPVEEPASGYATDRPNLGEDSQVTTIGYRSTGAGSGSGQQASRESQPSPSKRPTVVDAFLEPVGVIQHHLSPEQQSSEDVTLLFGGDVSLENIAYDKLPESGGLFTELEEYLQADLSMVTLGSPLARAATTLEEELYDRNRLEAVNLLAESGIDIVNLTNNSLMEHGTQGLDETLKALDSKGLYRLGAGRNETEARRPEVIDVKGKRIAYLSYSMGGDNAAFGDRAGTNAQDMKEIVEDIQALRDEVDWIVVNYRWVDFVSEEPNFKQTNLARLAIDQGADVVVGYHPDIIQGAEVYKGRPIAYSVGDFVFETENSTADQDSAMLKVALKQDQMKVEFVPVRVKNSLPQALAGPEGKAVLQKIDQASQQFEQPMQSPMVLDLKDKAPAAPQAYDPESPFVSPEAEDTLPVEPEPAAPAEEPTDSKQPTADPTADPAAPKATPQPSTPATDEAKPLPETLDLMDQLEENLLEWGPKPSDGQQEFQPIPQNLRESKEEEVDAHLSPGLLRLLQQPAQPSSDPGSSGEPSQDRGDAAFPEELSRDLSEETSGDLRDAEPGEEIPGNLNAAPSSVRAMPVTPPGRKRSVESASPPGEETSRALATPEDSTPEDSNQESTASPADGISPHSEPLVGPLSALEKPAPLPRQKATPLPQSDLLAQLSVGHAAPGSAAANSVAEGTVPHGPGDGVFHEPQAVERSASTPSSPGKD